MPRCAEVYAGLYINRRLFSLSFFFVTFFLFFSAQEERCWELLPPEEELDTWVSNLQLAVFGQEVISLEYQSSTPLDLALIPGDAALPSPPSPPPPAGDLVRNLDERRTVNMPSPLRGPAMILPGMPSPQHVTTASPTANRIGTCFCKYGM